jgi:hypothetical protein
MVRTTASPVLSKGPLRPSISASLMGAGDCAITGDKQKAAANKTSARGEENNDKRILKIEPALTRVSAESRAV